MQYSRFVIYRSTTCKIFKHCCALCDARHSLLAWGLYTPAGASVQHPLFGLVLG
jgi:hypothetical protein